MPYSPNSRKADINLHMGTRDLAFFQVDMNTNVETDYTESNSLYHKAIEGLQTRLELYGVGKPEGNWFTVIASASSAPFPEGRSNGDHNSNSILIDAVEAATGLTSVTVFNTMLNGYQLENNC